MLKDYLRFGIYACLFTTPFLASYVSDSMFFPFITGKNFAFRVLVEIALACYVLLALIDTTVRPKYNHLLGTFAAFIAVIFAADVFGADPHKSLWSNYERMEGFVTHIHLFFYFLVLMCVVRTEKLWSWFANTWLVSSLFIFIGATRQFMGLERFYMGVGRADSGLGNSEYVGIFGLFNVFLAAFLFLRSGKSVNLKVWYGMMVLMNFVLTFMSGTRGSVIGLMGGILLSLALFAIFDKAHPRLRRYAFGSIAALILFGAAVMLNPESRWVKSVHVLDRIAHIRLSEGTADSRITVWKISWEGFKERPILGWGQENFIQVFSEKFHPDASRLEPWYDRSHDVFFDWLVAAGVLGLLAYLSLYVAALYYLWFFEGGKRFTPLERALMTGMIAGYFVHNIFVFDNLLSYMFFFGLLAWIASRITDGEKESGRIKEESLDSGDIAIIAAVICTVLAVVAYYVNVRNIAANQELIMTMQQAPNHVGQLVTQNGKQYLRIAPLVAGGMIGTNEAREQVIQQALGVAQQSAQGKFPKNMAEEYVQLADKMIRTRLEENPRDLRMITFAITFYSNLGKLDDAEKLFAEAIKISPKRGALYQDMAQAIGGRGDYARALTYSEKAMEYMPRVAQPIGLHALLLAYNNRGGEIAAIYKNADEKGYIRGESRLPFAQAYQKVGDHAKVQEILAKAVSEDPALAEKLKAAEQKK